MIYYKEDGIRFLAVSFDEQEVGNDVVVQWSLEELTGNRILNIRSILLSLFIFHRKNSIKKECRK